MSEADLLKMVQDQISALETDSARSPDRIRLTEMIPPGDMYLTPYEKDGSVPSLERRLWDRGPVELLIHPDDWKKFVEDWKRYIVNQSSNEPKPVPNPDALRSRGPSLYGIPVVDDTIEARMRKEEARGLPGASLHNEKEDQPCRPNRGQDVEPVDQQ